MRKTGAGFVLVLVLAMLVILSLLAGTVAAITARLRDQALERRQQVQAEIDMASTQATLYYLLSTQSMTMGGLTVDNRVAAAQAEAARANSEFAFQGVPVGNEIALDARTYQGLGDTRFAIQDDAGLFGINHESLPALERLLGQAGHPPEPPPAVLFGRLMDYQDPDDLYRLDSMERDGYLRLGLPPPSNRALTTPMELRRIPGWPEALSFLSAGEINDTITVVETGSLNVNTAPARVLRTIGGMAADAAERIVARRKVQPFLYESAFFEFAGLPAGTENMVALYPSTSGTLKLWPSHGGQVRLVHWTLTPVDDGGRPWREDYELNQTQSRSAGDAALKVASRLFAKPVAAPD